MIEVSSSTFEPGKPIPRDNTGEGADQAPIISWKDVPENTREIAVICDDPDAPREEPWTHWLVYGIPSDQHCLSPQNADQLKQGVNDFGNTQYNGPMPPPGHGTHHYHFKVHALDQPLGLDSGATRKDLLKAMEGHIIDSGEIVGTYER